MWSVWIGDPSEAAIARAQPGETIEVAPNHAAQSPGRDEWYGLGMAIGDAAFLGGMLAGYYLTPVDEGRSRDFVSAAWVLPGYLLLVAVDPIIHWANLNPWGFLSLGLTLTASLAAVAIGDDDAILELAVLMVLVKVLDVGLLAYRQRPRERRGVRVMPSGRMVRGGGTVSATFLF